MEKKTQIHQTHPDIIKRLRRAYGHLATTINMLENGRPCVEVAQQLHAIEKAIANAKKSMIHDHIDHCLASTSTSQEVSHATLEFKKISKYL